VGRGYNSSGALALVGTNYDKISPYPGLRGLCFLSVGGLEGGLGLPLFIILRNSSLASFILTLTLSSLSLCLYFKLSFLSFIFLVEYSSAIVLSTFPLYISFFPQAS